MGKENGQHSEEVSIFSSWDWCSVEEFIHNNHVSFSILFFNSLPPLFFLRSLMQRLDGKSKDISKIAADITQNVSLQQGMERKKVIQHIRGLYKTDLSASRHWQELVQQLTHDRWVWTFTCVICFWNTGTKSINDYSSDSYFFSLSGNSFIKGEISLWNRSLFHGNKTEEKPWPADKMLFDILFQCGLVWPDILPNILAAGPHWRAKPGTTTAAEMLPHHTKQIPAQR